MIQTPHHILQNCEQPRMYPTFRLTLQSQRTSIHEEVQQMKSIRCQSSMLSAHSYLHHLYEQEDTLGVFPAREETLDAQHLHAHGQTPKRKPNTCDISTSSAWHTNEEACRSTVDETAQKKRNRFSSSSHFLPSISLLPPLSP